MTQNMRSYVDGERDPRLIRNQALEYAEQEIEEPLPLKDEFVLSSGVRVRVKPVPPGFGLRISRRLEKNKPKVPKLKQKDPETGREFSVDDPDDPDYKQAVEDYNIQIGMALREVILAFFVDILEVPEGLPTWQDDEWLEQLEMIGEEAPEKPGARRVAWFDTVGITTESDYAIIQGVANANQDVTESEVSAAEDGFPGDDRRGALDEVQPEIHRPGFGDSEIRGARGGSGGEHSLARLPGDDHAGSGGDRRL